MKWAEAAVFGDELRAMNERYLLAVPSNTLVRDLDAAAEFAEITGAASAENGDLTFSTPTIWGGRGLAATNDVADPRHMRPDDELRGP